MKLEELRNKVVEDVEKFVFNNFYLRDGRRLKLSEYQAKIIREALERQNGKFVILSGTRMGKSTAVAVLAILTAILNVGEEIAVISPIFRQSIEGIFEEIKSFIERNKKMKKLVKRIRQGRIDFKNGSKIFCLTASAEEGLLGYGASVVIVDEAGSIEARVIKERILRMLMTNRDGKKNLLFLIGTPHNIESYLFEAWNSNDFVKYRITWKDAVKAGIMNKEEVEFAKRTLSEDEFAVWYNGEWRQLGEELFFDMGAVKEASVIERKSYRMDDLRLFDIVLGYDIGRFGNSKSVVAVVGRLKGADDERLYFIDYRIVSKKGMDWQIGWVMDLAKRFNASKVVVDATGLGSTAYDVLKERLGEKVEVVGFDFGKRKERLNLYNNLKYLIEEGRLLLLDDVRLRENFNAFRVKYRSDGTKDIEKRRDVESDIVDSLALAVYGLEKGDLKYYTGDFMNLDEYFSIIAGGGMLW